MTTDLSLVLTAYNEEECLEAVIEEASAALPRLGTEPEILVVDDGSEDRTREIALRAAAANDRVRVVSYSPHRGKSSAIVAGVAAARGEWILTMDADGQNDPADFFGLWSIAQQGEGTDSHALVCGQRRNRADTWIKRASSRIANAIRKGLLNDATPDSGCGLKLFRKSDFLRLPQFENMHRFLPALFLGKGGAVVSHPVNDRVRRGGKSKYGIHNRLWIGMIDLLGVLWLVRRSVSFPDVERRRDV